MASRTRYLTLSLLAGAAVAVVVTTQLSPSASDASGARWQVAPAVSVKKAPVKKPAPKPVPSTKPSSTPTKATTAPAPAPSASPSSIPAPAAAPQPFLGTLATHANTAQTESADGMKMAMMEFSWRNFEPSRGVFNSSYANSELAQLRQYQAAGMKVTLGLGLHYTPQWVLDTAGSRMVDEYGNTSSSVDLVFNQNMRTLAVDYLSAVDKAVGLQNFWAIRITSGGGSELVYPSNNFWAYSSGAQNGAAMPSGMAPNPMPGWKPGQAATAAERKTWANWYLGALDNEADWEISAVSALGFDGYYQIVTPGQGMRPSQFDAQIQNGLTDGLLGRGAVWNLVYDGLAHRTNITAYVSSVGDGAASDNTCTPADDNVSINSSAVFLWSSPRWIAYIARQNGFTVAGEVPGYPSSGAAAQAHYTDTSSSGLMAHAIAESDSCGFLGLYWAHDDQLWNGTMPVSQFARYAPSRPLAPQNAS